MTFKPPKCQICKGSPAGMIPWPTDADDYMCVPCVRNEVAQQTFTSALGDEALKLSLNSDELETMVFALHNCKGNTRYHIIADPLKKRLDSEITRRILDRQWHPGQEEEKDD